MFRLRFVFVLNSLGPGLIPRFDGGFWNVVKCEGGYLFVLCTLLSF